MSPFGADRHRGAGHWFDQVPVSRAVRRVADDRQVAEPFDNRDRGEVKRVAGSGFVGTNATLAEDDLVVALGHDVLGGEQPLVDGSRTDRA